MADEGIACIEELIRAFASRDPHKLRNSSAVCSTNLALSEEKSFFYLALIAYSLSKIITKPRYEGMTKVLFKKINNSLVSALAFKRAGRENDVEKELEKILYEITSIEKADKRFIHDVIEKGRTKIAALLYAEGLSLERAVALTGAQRNEVLNYSGKTMMADRFGKTISAHERLKKARNILK